MPSTEVQRTLVKSPPELWAELSDPASLARHLGELGEIQLTRVEPESAVEWEAENVKGSVQLKASGWGTKVTFSLTRELPASTAPEPAVGDAVPSEPEPEQVAAEPEPEPIATEPEPEQVAAEPKPEPIATEPEPEPEPEQVAAEPEPEPVAAEPEPEPIVREPEPVAAEPEPIATEPEPEQEPAEPETTAEPRPTRRGFFARLFRRRRAEPAAEFQEPATGLPADLAEPEVPEPVVEVPEENLAGVSMVAATEELPVEAQREPRGATTREPRGATTREPQDATSERFSDLAAELALMEQAMVEQDTALLTAVLDRLGAAHHRPFSRG